MVFVLNGSGRVPSQLGRLVALQDLRFAENKLTGTMCQSYKQFGGGVSSIRAVSVDIYFAYVTDKSTDERFYPRSALC